MLRCSNYEVFGPSSHAAPAAICWEFVNGAIGARLPTTSQWKQAYASDHECVLIFDLICNPLQNLQRFVEKNPSQIALPATSIFHGY